MMLVDEYTDRPLDRTTCLALLQVIRVDRRPLVTRVLIEHRRELGRQEKQHSVRLRVDRATRRAAGAIEVRGTSGADELAAPCHVDGAVAFACVENERVSRAILPGVKSDEKTREGLTERERDEAERSEKSALQDRRGRRTVAEHQRREETAEEERPFTEERKLLFHSGNGCDFTVERRALHKALERTLFDPLCIPVRGPGKAHPA